MPKPLSPEKRLEWEEKIQQQQASGLSIERWCLKAQIKTHTFHYWKDRLHPKVLLDRSCFTELSNAKSPGISIEYQGIRIHVDNQFDSITLQRCLAVLMGVKC